MSLRHRLAKLAALSREERVYLLAATSYLLQSRLLLLTREMPELLGSVSGRDALSPGGDTASGLELKPGLAAWAIGVAATAVPWRADCLVQAIAAVRWLSAGGLSPRLHLGATFASASHLKAHAWVSLDGVPVAGGTGEGYAAFESLDVRCVAR